MERLAFYCLWCYCHALSLTFPGKQITPKVSFWLYGLLLGYLSFYGFLPMRCFNLDLATQKFLTTFCFAFKSLYPIDSPFHFWRRLGGIYNLEVFIVYLVLRISIKNYSPRSALLNLWERLLFSRKWLFFITWFSYFGIWFFIHFP